MFRNTFSSVDNQTLSNASIDYYIHVQSDLGIDIGVDRVGYLWLMTERQLSAAEPHLAEDGRQRRRVPDLREGRAREDDSRFRVWARTPTRRRSWPSARYRERRLRPEVRPPGSRQARRLLQGPVQGAGRRSPVQRRREAPRHRREGADGDRGRALRMAGMAGDRGQARRRDRDLGRDGGGGSGRRGTTSSSTRWESTVTPRPRSASSSRSRSRESRAWSGCSGREGSTTRASSPSSYYPRPGSSSRRSSESAEFWIGCEDEVNRPYISYPEHDLDSYTAEPSYYERDVYPVLREYFPQFDGARPARMWAGLYGYNTLDNLPFVFAENGLVVVGGDSGSGVMKGDSLGQDGRRGLPGRRGSGGRPARRDRLQGLEAWIQVPGRREGRLDPLRELPVTSPSTSPSSGIPE